MDGRHSHRTDSSWSVSHSTPDPQYYRDSSRNLHLHPPSLLRNSNQISPGCHPSWPSTRGQHCMWGQSPWTSWKGDQI